MARRAGQTFPYNDCQLGSGAGRAQSIVRYALVVPCVLQCQLVDEQDSRVLGLHSSERLDGLAVLQPVQHRRRLTRAVAHKPGCVSPGEGHSLWGLENHWRGYRKQRTKLLLVHYRIHYGTCMMF